MGRALDRARVQAVLEAAGAVLHPAAEDQAQADLVRVRVQAVRPGRPDRQVHQAIPVAVKVPDQAFQYRFAVRRAKILTVLAASVPVRIHRMDAGLILALVVVTCLAKRIVTRVGAEAFTRLAVMRFLGFAV